MAKPLFDFDLKRVSRRHYITGKAAVNFPLPGAAPVAGTSFRTLTEGQESSKYRLQEFTTQTPMRFLATRASLM